MGMDKVRLFAHQTNKVAAPRTCSTSNGYDGWLPVRISSIFVILVASTLGAVFPVFAKRHSGMGVPDSAFFVAKYFGSGVIIATAFVHLLAPANEALGNECLHGVIAEYPWPEGIALMSIFLMFFLEIMTMRYGDFGGHSHDHHLDHSEPHPHTSNGRACPESDEATEAHHSPHPTTEIPQCVDSMSLTERSTKCSDPPDPEAHHFAPGDDHLGHSREHRDNPTCPDWQEHGHIPESYTAQMTGIFILEFGIIFHSIFIGLTLAVSGSEFVTLYIILTFHQAFEGLGLGARIATIPWPRSKRWTPYVLAVGFGITTPIAIAIGLGVRKTYAAGSETFLIVKGVFDSISAGILIYTGLVELMAHEFMFSPYMQKGPAKRVFSAFALMCLGAALMALLGEWA